MATYFPATARPFRIAGAYVEDTAVSIAAAVSARLVIETIVASWGVPFAAMMRRTRAVPVCPIASRDEPRLMSRADVLGVKASRGARNWLSAPACAARNSAADIRAMPSVAVFVEEPAAATSGAPSPAVKRCWAVKRYWNDAGAAGFAAATVATVAAPPGSSCVAAKAPHPISTLRQLNTSPTGVSGTVPELRIRTNQKRPSFSTQSCNARRAEAGVADTAGNGVAEAGGVGAAVGLGADAGLGVGTRATMVRGRDVAARAATLQHDASIAAAIERTS